MRTPDCRKDHQKRGTAPAGQQDRQTITKGSYPQR